jgi:hypothetical protein
MLEADRPLKHSNDTIGNRTRDLPASSAVPQLTAPPRAPLAVHMRIFYLWLVGVALDVTATDL